MLLLIKKREIVKESGSKIYKKGDSDMQDLLIQEVFSMRNVIIYFIIVNLLGFLVMFIDKQKAKKGSWRIPEKTLFIITALGGGIGTITGMYFFRHKTKKIAFVVGFPLITIIEIVTIVYFSIF